MPILYSTKSKCEKCNKEFEWCYFKYNRKASHSNFCAETSPTITMSHHFEPTISGDYIGKVNCPFCGYDNFVPITNEEYTNYKSTEK